MKKEVLVTLIKELFGMDELHEEYQDNDVHCVIDTLKEGNTLNIKISLIENKDKKEFQAWIDSMDDELFTEVWERLSKKFDGKKLNDDYNSDKNYKHVIDKFKKETNLLIQEKINKLKKFAF